MFVSFDVGGNESLASKSSFLGVKIYSARAKLMLISGQTRDLVKNYFVSLSKQLVCLRGDLE